MATTSGRPRHCVYCPEPSADACVRVQEPEHDGAHIYAHRECAKQRGKPLRYIFIPEAAPAGEHR
ncbi:hypothetical protein ACFRFJ_34120 [Streptomyces hydrogenans]|uniref:hypothetical protein n=1 Tax=Streptomyces hydrogenans TaxID=1873719 RepID=UPI0036BB7D62